MLKRIATLEAPPPWGLFAGIGLLVAMFAAMVIGTTIAQLTLPESPAQPFIGWIIGGLLTIVVVMVSRQRTDDERTALRLGASRLPLPIVLLFSIGAAILIDVIGLGLTGDFWPVPEVMGFFLINEANFSLLPRSVDAFAWIAAGVFLILIQPVAEEFVLRGVLYPALRTNAGAWPGLLMNAAFHMAFHLLTYVTFRMNGFTPVWYAAVATFLDALVIAGVRAYTGSTRAAIVAHVGFGVFAFLKALAISG
jgi:membrane protease YdiL (CAAX protease family)